MSLSPAQKRLGCLQSCPFLSPVSPASLPQARAKCLTPVTSGFGDGRPPTCLPEQRRFHTNAHLGARWPTWRPQRQKADTAVSPQGRGGKGERPRWFNSGRREDPAPEDGLPLGPARRRRDAARLFFRLWEGPLGGLTSPARVPLQPLCKNTAHGHAGSFVLHLRPPG